MRSALIRVVLHLGLLDRFGLFLVLDLLFFLALLLIGVGHVCCVALRNHVSRPLEARNRHRHVQKGAERDETNAKGDDVEWDSEIANQLHEANEPAGNGTGEEQRDRAGDADGRVGPVERVEETLSVKCCSVRPALERAHDLWDSPQLFRDVLGEVRVAIDVLVPDERGRVRLVREAKVQEHKAEAEDEWPLPSVREEAKVGVPEQTHHSDSGPLPSQDAVHDEGHG
mmetsp:Transcript_11979/g.38332  ORF Transcript_11979/g.38332 Transcript_11979/m.38332 type:complete len:227 (-) Transcript_11979:670-1350(-)